MSPIVKLQHKGIKIAANPKGGYITSWQIKNPHTKKFEEILYQGSESKRSGIPILFPQFNNNPPLPKHGFGRDSDWKVKLLDKSIVLTLTDKEINTNLKACYPYQFKAEIKVFIEDKNSIIYSLKVDNLGQTPLPICPALHPYFAIQHQDKINLITEGIPSFDPAFIDWENNPPDAHFPFRGKFTVTFPEGKFLKLEDITSRHVVKYLQIWSQTKDKDDYNFVCFEPLTRLDNAINNKDCIEVKPKQSWNMRLRFSVKFE